MPLNIWTGATDGDMSVTSNWSLAAIPVTNDDVLVPSWALNGWTAALGTLAAVTINSLVVQKGFSKDMGDDENFAQLLVTGAGTNYVIYEGEGARAKLDLGATIADVIVKATGAKNLGDPALQLKGTDMTELVVLGGDVAVGFEEDDTTTDVDTVHVGSGLGFEPYVQLGRGVTGNSAVEPNVNLHEGTFLSSCNITTLQQLGGTSIQREGVWEILNLYGGIHHPDSADANYGTANVFQDGQLHNTRDLRAKTFAVLNLHDGSAYWDEHGRITLTAGPHFIGRVQNVDLRLRPDISMPITLN